jgi:GNAT superfamily N-acetyltransferase
MSGPPATNLTQMTGYRIRPCTPGDAATIARHRVAMFRDMGDVATDEAARALFDASVVAISAELNRGAYAGWLAITEQDDVIAGVGAHVKVNLPRMASDGIHIASSPVPLVVNVYTEPAWRNRGIARALMGTLMEWVSARGFDRVVLHASDGGRPLYVSLGFVPTNEMRWSAAKGQN